MSNLINDRVAESLFERLEALEGYMNAFEYQDKQQTISELLEDGELGLAVEITENCEREYAPRVAESFYEADCG